MLSLLFCRKAENLLDSREYGPSPLKIKKRENGRKTRIMMIFRNILREIKTVKMKIEYLIYYSRKMTLPQLK